MEASERIATIDAIHDDARKQGLFFLNPEDEALTGRTLRLHGEDRLSFASCSYLGLELHPALIAGVVDAVQRYGTQFSATRGFVSAPPYRKLEEKMSALLGGHALVTSSTSLGHQSALGVLATERDAIVLDHQAHYSIQQAAQLSRTSGCQVEIVRHGDLESALPLIRKLAATKKTVWLGVDGVYSMYGDLVPVDLLQRALDVAPNVRLYVDDAHGMSWAGKHGRGSFLSRMPLTERMVVATSLNKAFAAGGGCLLFADEREREHVRKTGGPLFFSGPLQPPMLGAALASAELHLSPEIEVHQRALARRVALTNGLLRDAGLPLLVENESPIFFLRLGLPKLAFEVAHRMMADGIFVTPSVYPTVPLRRGGIRLSITAAHTEEDLRRVVERLAVHIPAVHAEEGVSREALDQDFARALPGGPAKVAVSVPAAPAPSPASGLRVERFTSIRHIDREEWNRLLGTAGFISWDSLAMQEEVFSSSSERENDWQFVYLLVRDGEGTVRAAGAFTAALVKDDMIMREEVSARVEELRRQDPYFLASKTFMLGSLLSEGNHLFLDRKGPWREALVALVGAAREEHDRLGCAVLMFRDLPDGDPEIAEAMLKLGLLKAPMLTSFVLPITFRTDEAYVASLPRKRRKDIAQRIEHMREFDVRIRGARGGTSMSADEVHHLYGLYRAVADKALRMNVYPLPERLLQAMLKSPAWEIVTLHLRPEHGGPANGAPVAFFAGHMEGGCYGGFLCGMDYRFVASHNVYRQMLIALVRRAMETGATTLRLGLTAEIEKQRLGGVATRNVVYVEAKEHWNGAQLREIAAEISVEAPAETRAPARDAILPTIDVAVPASSVQRPASERRAPPRSERAPVSVVFA